MTETPGQFMDDLRKLRVSAGNPSFRVLEKKTRIPRSTLNDALRGNGVPPLDTTLGLVREFGGDEQEWRQRWEAVHTSASPKTAEQPRRPFWRRPLVIGAAVAVVAVLITGGAIALSRPGCEQWREYTVNHDGPVMDAEKNIIGDVRPGDVVRARSLDRGNYNARYEVTVLRTGQTGYVLMSKLEYVRTVCA